MRWCASPTCETHMRAPNDTVKYLTCPTCGTEVCFACKEVWHGENVSCNDALGKELQAWIEENRDRVSQCPCCKSRIEKTSGCNHMTCYFCKYEFCWACGESASSGDNHWTNGCGVGMMDSSVRPGDHLKLNRGVRSTLN